MAPNSRYADFVTDISRDYLGPEWAATSHCFSELPEVPVASLIYKPALIGPAPQNLLGLNFTAT